MIQANDGAKAERVTTRLWLAAPPDAVWEGLMFYEDVPRRPSRILRLLLPLPARSEGDKRRVGASVHCVYSRGYLVKRITMVEAARRLEFEIVEQHLGIETKVITHRGSYQLVDVRGGTELLLTTWYWGRLRPRFLWRAIERLLCHRLHRHVLYGMRDALTAKGQLSEPTPESSERDPAVASR
jgi:hypothetical protein